MDVDDVVSSMLTGYICHLPLIYHWTHFHQITSLDLNALTSESSAFPQLVNGTRDSHGTSCAGIIAMEKSNDVCGVGVAYRSSITGKFTCTCTVS